MHDEIIEIELRGPMGNLEIDPAAMNFEQAPSIMDLMSKELRALVTEDNRSNKHAAALQKMSGKPSIAVMP
jgi:hypothetical protein